MANRENIALAKFIPWAERQMIAARSSGSGWSIVLSHAAGVAFSLLAPLAVLAAGLVLDEWQMVPLALGAMAAYWGGAILSTLAIEVSMQRIFRRNEVPSPWLNARAALWIIPGIVATHFVYLRLLIGVCLRNRVSWRTSWTASVAFACSIIDRIKWLARMCGRSRSCNVSLAAYLENEKSRSMTSKLLAP